MTALFIFLKFSLSVVPRWLAPPTPGLLDPCILAAPLGGSTHQIKNSLKPLYTKLKNFKGEV